MVSPRWALSCRFCKCPLADRNRAGCRNALTIVERRYGADGVRVTAEPMLRACCGMQDLPAMPERADEPFDQIVPVINGDSRDWDEEQPGRNTTV